MFRADIIQHALELNTIELDELVDLARTYKSLGSWIKYNRTLWVINKCIVKEEKMREKKSENKALQYQIQSGPDCVIDGSYY